ncbi:MAG: hypothetical protein IPP63_08230 [Chloracidobacterium sp.]|nr:hypothetical protein [Chloracidobacterium sp.]
MGRKTLAGSTLLEIAWKLKSTKATVLFVGPNFPELKTLEKEVTQIELDLPRESEIEDSIELQFENLRSNGLDISLTKGNPGCTTAVSPWSDGGRDQQCGS